MFKVVALRNALPISRARFDSEADARKFATTLATMFETEAWKDGDRFYVDMNTLEAVEEIAVRRIQMYS